MTDLACRRYDAGTEVGELANVAKYLGAESGLQAIDAAISAYRGNGVAMESQLANCFFIVRILNMGPAVALHGLADIAFNPIRIRAEVLVQRGRLRTLG
jgi:alkylation response protein AidB-like acyl-CoA dehydrogenase